jgi:L-amino acid N-acyltransferase YncA
MRLEFPYAGAEDLEKIVGTYNSTIPSRLVTADLEPVSVADKKKWFESHNHEERPLWIVIHNGIYAGWMSFNSFYGRPAYNGTVEVSIYLEENMRGKKIGEACLKKAIAEAPSRNVHTLLGFIFGHNRPSIQLFKKHGFAQWACLPEVANMDGVMRDLLIMGKKV